jgi:Spy/CpxP family protein refolding chaperone
MSGSRTRVALLLLVVFVAGAAAGVAADRLDLLPGAARAEQPAPRDDRDSDRGSRQTTIERFADELGLTAGQRSAIEDILDGFRGDVKSLRAEFHPRYRALLDTTRTRIEAVLTEEQVVQYRALLESQRRERRREGDGDRDDRRGNGEGRTGVEGGSTEGR